MSGGQSWLREASAMPAQTSATGDILSVSGGGAKAKIVENGCGVVMMGHTEGNGRVVRMVPVVLSRTWHA
jgi:hypothetical protein